MTSFDGVVPTQSAADTFRAQAEARGVPADQIESTLAKHRIGAQPQPKATGAAPEPSPLAPDLNASKHPRLAPGDLEKAADNLARYWTGDPRVLHDALERAGLERVDDAADQRTELEQQFDAALGAPASADDYALPDLLVGHDGLDKDSMVQVAGAVRTALSEMQVPKHLGSALGKAILDAVERSNEAHGIENAHRSHEQVALACKALKVGREELFGAVRALTAKLGPEGRELLEHALAAGHSADILVHLYQSAELGAVRKGLGRTR